MPILSAAPAARATRAMPGLPGMGIGRFIRIRLRAAAAARRAPPLSGHSHALENESSCYVPAVWTDDRIDRHGAGSWRTGWRSLLRPPPAELLGGGALPQPFANQLCSLDHGVELILRDVSLEQNQPAVGRDPQAVRRDHL